jgi:hypothetical protein
MPVDQNPELTGQGLIESAQEDLRRLKMHALTGRMPPKKKLVSPQRDKTVPKVITRFNTSLGL